MAFGVPCRFLLLPSQGSHIRTSNVVAPPVARDPGIDNQQQCSKVLCPKNVSIKLLLFGDATRSFNLDGRVRVVG
jgi:hypothetical protein